MFDSTKNRGQRKIKQKTDKKKKNKGIFSLLGLEKKSGEIEKCEEKRIVGFTKRIFCPKLDGKRMGNKFKRIKST